MVTSIPNENELYSLQRKIKKWYSQEEPSKQTNYIYQNVVVYHTHFGDCKKTIKNNKIYNLKYKNIIKNDTYINKNSKIDTLKNSLNKTL